MITVVLIFFCEYIPGFKSRRKTIKTEILLFILGSLIMGNIYMYMAIIVFSIPMLFVFFHGDRLIHSSCYYANCVIHSPDKTNNLNNSHIFLFLSSSYL